MFASNLIVTNTFVIVDLMTSSIIEYEATLTTGFTVPVRQAGVGKPVLVLHGGAGQPSITTTIEHFAQDSFVLAPTHPGWHGVPRPERVRTVADLAAGYLLLLEHHDLTDVTLVGTSFGGWVAAEIALQDSAHRIGRLVLVGALGPRIDGQPVTVPTAPPPGQGGPGRAGIAALLEYAGDGLEDPDLLARMAELKLPALLLWGADDTIVPPEFGRRYAEGLTNARFELVEGAGHLPVVQAPVEAFTLIDDFLAGTR
jgi:pimeloyl-ACP methyl ester carboxylesterase